MYTIDLETISQLLREFRRNGILWTELPLGFPRLKGPCFVVIEIQRGDIASCHIKDAKGQTLLLGEEAIQAVSASGKLNWVFDMLPEQELPGVQQNQDILSRRVTAPLNTGPLPAPLALPASPRGTTLPSFSNVPQRLLNLDHANMTSWPRRHRQVYALVDNVRTIGQIATILSLPPQVIEDILQDIQSTGAIRLPEL